MFEETDHFAVNILSDKQLELAEIYANKTRHRLEQGSFATGISGIPVLRNSIAAFLCMVKNRYREGDHIIIIGEVMEIRLSDGDPLVFFNGRDRELKA